MPKSGLSEHIDRGEFWLHFTEPYTYLKDRH